MTPGVVAGLVKWRLEFRHVASPVARLLLPEAGGTSGIFAVFGKVGHSPRVYASRDRDALLKQLQTAAYKKMGLTLAGVSCHGLHFCMHVLNGLHMHDDLHACTQAQLLLTHYVNELHMHNDLHACTQAQLLLTRDVHLSQYRSALPN